MRWMLGCVATLSVLTLLVWYSDARIQWDEDRRSLDQAVWSTPSCYEAWHSGDVLYEDYSGCHQDKSWGGQEIVEPEKFDCPSGSGSDYYLAEGGEDGSYAVPGGRIRTGERGSDGGEITDEAFLDRVCEPPLPDCFETWREGRLLPDPYRGCTLVPDFEEPAVFGCPVGSRSQQYISFATDFGVEGGPVLSPANPIKSKRLVDPSTVRRVCNSAVDGQPPR